MLQLLEVTISWLSDLCEPVERHRHSIIGCLVTYLAGCRILQLILTYRSTSERIGVDIFLRVLWFVLLSVASWIPYVICGWWWDEGWLIDLLEQSQIGIWGLQAVTIMLTASSLFSPGPSLSRRFHYVRFVVAGVFGASALMLLVLDVQIEAGYIATSLLTIEITEGHVFRYFSMEPQGANIHKAAGVVMTVLNAAAFLLVLHLGCVIYLLRTPRSWMAAIGAFLFLSLAMMLAFYADGWLVEKISPDLFEFVISRDMRRLGVLLLVAMPVSAACAWKMAGVNVPYVGISRTDSPWQDGLGWCEFGGVVFLAVTVYICAFEWFFWGGWRGVGFFMYAGPMFACMFASGRWVKMHWSRDLIRPDTYFVQFPLRRWAVFSVMVTAQLITFSMLFGWAMYITEYVPLP